MAAVGIWVAAFPPGSAHAQVDSRFRTAPRSLITQEIERSETITIPGAMRGIRLTDQGPADGATPMEHVQLLLRRPAERQAAFDAAVEALHTLGSSSYHKWLKPSDIGAEFGLSGADVATLTAYLESEGFRVNFVSPSDNLIDFTGTSGQIERSFKTEIHNVRMENGELRYAALQPPSIPAALGPAVIGFVSLGNAEVPRPLLRKPLGSSQTALSGGLSPRLRPQNTETIDGSTYYDVGPQDFYTIYNETPLLTASTPINGSGQTIALLEETDINTADVTHFRTTFNVLPNTPSLTVLHGSGTVICGDPGILNSNTDDEEGEAVLDTEWAGAVAPAATLLFVSCESTKTTAGIFLSAEAVIYNNLASTVSLSYGYYEGGAGSENATANDLWEQAAAQGETVVVSSGDSGSDAEDQDAKYATHGLNVSGFSSTAYNVSAGGTDFQDTYNQGLGDTAYEVSTFWNSSNTSGDSSAKGYIPETTWNDTCAGSLASYYVTGLATPTAFCDTRQGYVSFLATGGGSGGISIINARPTFQNATVYGLPGTPAYRLLPDISLFASNGFWGHLLDYFESDVSPTALQIAGGTSFVAPQLAGVFALIDQSTGERQGQADYVLYPMAGIEYGTTSATGACNGSGAGGTGTTSELPANSCIFHDVETGNISQACSKNSPNCYVDSGNYGILSTSSLSDSPAYPAGAGYDLATGLGSINITNLVDNWQSTTTGILFTPTVLVASSLGSYLYGSPEAITYTATVSGVGSFPTGSVQFSGSPIIGAIGSADALVGSAGCSSAGPCTESAQQSYLPFATLPAGAYTIGATYSPTNENYTSATGTIRLTVNQQTPTLQVSNVAIPAGNLNVVLTATLAFSGSGLAPTGGVNFSVNGGAIISGACVGVASPTVCTVSYPISTLGPGTYNISASYPGDINFTAVGPKTATLTLVSNPATIRFSVASPQHTMIPTINLAASSNNASGAMIYIVVSGPATVSGSVATLTGAGTVELQVTQAAGSTYSLTSATTTFAVVAGSIWIADSTNDVSTFDLMGNVILPSPGLSGGGIGTVATPQGVAFDEAGDLWVTSSAGISEFNRYGIPVSASPITSGGIASPLSLVIDGAGTVWVANADGSVSAISNAGAPLSLGGYPGAATGSTRGGIAVDLSGNVWLTSSGGNTVTEILGVGAPIAPPSTSLANKTVGQTP